jgi:hypothetical protein
MSNEFFRQKAIDNEGSDLPNHPNRLRTILSRAALVYLGLFLGISTFLSILGIDPLIHNGAILKCLLIYVGLALILALANSKASMVDELARSWLALASKRPFRER